MIVLVLGVTLLRPASTPVTPAPRPAQTRAKSARAAAAAQTPGPVAPVKLRALAETRQGPGETKRNPFRFQPKAAPPAPKPVVTPQPTTIEAPKPIGPPPPPVPAPIALKLIGILERANGVKWAVLSDGKSGTPFYGKDGDIIDGRFQIVKIGTESIEMTYADGKGRTVIRLTGQ